MTREPRPRSGVGLSHGPTVTALGAGLLVVAWAGACASSGSRATAGAPAEPPRLAVPLVTDEAEAVLEILRKRASGETIAPADWQRLFGSEGYRRLQQRERSLQRPFEDSTFRAFVLSDSLLARAPALRATLEAWRRVDPRAAAARAFAYLPAQAVIRARIYPVIKPRTNSFVFETSTNPAIFLYLDPAVPAAKFENTLAHELHHIGLAAVCREARDSTASAEVRRAREWMGGFGEGRAMLAAAGGPDIHPHAPSEAAERAGWERAMSRVGQDLESMQAFFFDLLDGRLSEEEAARRGYRFLNTDDAPQGPFYTLGWLVSATVERELGRERLIASTCDPRMFLSDYQRAAERRNRVSGDSLPLWSPDLLRRIGATAPAR